MKHLRRIFLKFYLLFGWPHVAHLQGACPGGDIRLPATPDARQFLLPVPLPLWSFLFEVSPFDPGVLGLSAIAMLLLALAASALPATRASGTDPMLVLRGE